MMWKWMYSRQVTEQYNSNNPKIDCSLRSVQSFSIYFKVEIQRERESTATSHMCNWMHTLTHTHTHKCSNSEFFVCRWILQIHFGCMLAWIFRSVCVPHYHFPSKSCIKQWLPGCVFFSLNEIFCRFGNKILWHLVATICVFTNAFQSAHLFSSHWRAKKNSTLP